MSEVTYFTQEGLEKLKEEVAHLKAVERINISKQIAEARDKGDLSETPNTMPLKKRKAC